MKIVTFGELLMRLSPPGFQKLAKARSYEVHCGGAEANLSIALAQYGHDVKFVSALPDTDIGKSLMREVYQWRVNTDHVHFNGHKMGLYFMEQGVSIRGGDIIYDRAGSSFSQIDASTFDWESILDGADWFHWTGITPGLSQGAALACAEAIKVANKKGITVSCDLNYRSKLWKYNVNPKDIMPELIAGCHVVLANEQDVSSYLGIEAKEEDASFIEGFGWRNYEFVSKAIVEQFPNVKYVISTLRQTLNATHNKWSAVLYDTDNFIRGATFEIDDIVDRVGGGDSFMGAYIHGTSRFETHAEVLDFALAASSLKITIPGDYNITSEKEVLNFLHSKGVGRLSR